MQNVQNDSRKIKKLIDFDTVLTYNEWNGAKMFEMEWKGVTKSKKYKLPLKPLK